MKNVLLKQRSRFLREIKNDTDNKNYIKTLLNETK